MRAALITKSNLTQARRKALKTAVAVICVGGVVVVPTAQAFNPQPDPPGRQAVAQASSAPADMIIAFNPQPDPPGRA